MVFVVFVVFGVFVVFVVFGVFGVLGFWGFGFGFGARPQDLKALGSRACGCCADL